MDTEEAVRKVAQLKEKIRQLKEDLTNAETELETILEDRAFKSRPTDGASVRDDTIRRDVSNERDTNGAGQRGAHSTDSQVGDPASPEEIHREPNNVNQTTESDNPNGPVKVEDDCVWYGEVYSKFSKDITERYSRQILLDQVGVMGQEKLLNASVLIVGCGGTGSPCIQYLAASGVGTLGLADYDRVELSNLHRQVIHTTHTIGQPKVTSAKRFISAINRNTIVHAYQTLLDTSNACDIIRRYDVVVDACDNAPTRYLLNDACLREGRPLVSASALGLEGQLCVYNYKGGPCYRCIYPVPPPAETVGTCGDNGVLGPVPGVMGTLQAVETIKLLIGLPVMDKLLVYDAELSKFLSVKLRKKKEDCVCAHPADTQLVDYEVFCSSRANDKTPDISILDPTEHLTALDYRDEFLARRVAHTLLDVRSVDEFAMMSLNIASHATMADVQLMFAEAGECPAFLESLREDILAHRHVFVICRRGNDSQKVVQLLKRYVERHRPGVVYDIRNIKEGYKGWQKYVDNRIPTY
ncbi:adenylyltransferase and sulfurtransferase MOCS3 [Diaphorina citri]|jgi:Dinucleotide-utilizing enzymes involved in molybdopterin and thiamine biosynthesis family 2|uniref:Ubiquitin activating enzyme 4 n=1 Tax=Diaphorina citri TaxID=121845 RepID=A0A1S3D7Z6_DIACI|nr:adenylyltransferase and sulfurtransferase MOCS3 [Diaphorina citri]